MNNTDWDTYYSTNLSEEIKQLCVKADKFKISEKYEDAIDCLDEAIRLNPLSPYLWFKKYSPLDSLNQFQESIDCLDEAIRLNPNYRDAWDCKGRALERNCFHEKYSTEEESPDPELHVELGEVPTSLENNDMVRRYEKALECFDEVIRLYSDDVDGWQNKASILNQLKRFEESVQFCTKAIEYFLWEERFARLQLWMSKIEALFGLKKYDEVILCCNDAKHNLGYIHEWYYSYKYDALIELKKFEDAIECCNDLLEHYGDNDGGFNYVGWMYRKNNALKKLGRDEEAEQCFAKARELDES